MTDSNLKGTKGGEEATQEKDDNEKEEEDPAANDVAFDKSNGEVHGQIDDDQEWHPWIRSKVGLQTHVHPPQSKRRHTPQLTRNDPSELTQLACKVSEMVSNARLGGWQTKPVDDVAADFGLNSGEDQLNGIVIHRSGAHLWDVFYTHGTGIHQLITTRRRAIVVIVLPPRNL